MGRISVFAKTGYWYTLSNIPFGYFLCPPFRRYIDGICAALEDSYARIHGAHERRSELERHASYYKTISRDLPAQCQLPDAVEVGTHGHLIRRPVEWC